MNSFLQFRLWLRQGPTAERIMATAAAVVALALLGWILVPTESLTESSTGAAVGAEETPAGAQPSITTAAGEAAAQSAAPTGGPSGAGASAATGGGAVGTAQTSAEGTADRCSGLTATDQGVTANQITVASTIYNVFGTNSTIGVQSPDQQKQIYEALWDAVNKSGGLHCRKIVGKFYEMNPLDQNSQQAGCLQIIADKPFAAVGMGGFFPQAQGDCLPRAKIPTFMYYGMTTAQQKELAPYIFSVGARVDHGMRTWVAGAQQQGFFDPAKGFKKLGLWETNCDADANGSLEQALAGVGLTGDKVSKFVSDCPISGQTPPSQCAQAVLQHQGAGVTHVFLAAGGSPNTCYINQAKRQGYKPRFSTSDYILGIGPRTVGESPDPAEFDGALGITLTRFGAINAGLPIEAGTKWCNDVFKSHGLPMLEKEDANALVAGTACANVQQFLAALSHAPAATRTSLAQGMTSAGNVALGWPAADGIFDRPDKVYGGDFYRAVIWHGDCQCWKAATPNWSRSV